MNTNVVSIICLMVKTLIILEVTHMENITTEKNNKPTREATQVTASSIKTLPAYSIGTDLNEQNMTHNYIQVN